MLADCARNRKVATLVQRCKKENFHTGAKENLGEATARDDSIPARDDPVRDDPSETIRFRCETIRARRSDPVRDEAIRARYGAIQDDPSAIRSNYGVPRRSTLRCYNAEELDRAFNLPGLQQEVSEGRTPLLGQ